MPRQLRVLLSLLCAMGAVAYGAWRRHAAAPRAEAPPAASVPAPPATVPSAPSATDPQILSAIARHRSHVWGVATGVVERLLEDDHKGIPHQRFILSLSTGSTVLVEYNLDLSPRIADLALGDTVTVRGEYLWNDQGGMIHWVHHDPSGAPGGGWVQVHGRKYQ